MPCTSKDVNTVLLWRKFEALQINNINNEIKKSNFRMRTESWPFYKKRDDKTTEMVFLCKSFVYNKTQRCEVRTGAASFIIMSCSNERCVKSGLILK